MLFKCKIWDPIVGVIQKLCKHANRNDKSNKI